MTENIEQISKFISLLIEELNEIKKTNEKLIKLIKDINDDRRIKPCSKK